MALAVHDRRLEGITTMESKPLRIGVAGVTYGATVHIPGLQSEGVEVAAVWSRRKEHVEQVADRFGIAHAFTDYDEMLRMPDLDAVSVVTPAATHYEYTVAALKAGKHVITEKPFTTDQAKAKDMWQLAQSTGLTAMLGHEFRFSSGRMRVKELIDEGYIGKPQLVVMRLIQGMGGGGGGARPAGAGGAPAGAGAGAGAAGRGGGAGGPQPFSPERDSAAAGAGFLWGLGSHYIDCLYHWLGEVESVSGEVTNVRPERAGPNGETIRTDADDTFLFTLKFVNGAIAQMIGSRAAAFGSGPRRRGLRQRGHADGAPARRQPACARHHPRGPHRRRGRAPGARDTGAPPALRRRPRRPPHALPNDGA
jgi:predicted dehydrogenase